MADDEQLRETLLEVQFLRQREAETLEATRRLAACLEAYSSAADAEAGLNALLAAIAKALSIDLVCLLEDAGDAGNAGNTGDTGAQVLAATDARLVGADITAPPRVFGKPRSIARAGLLGSWQGALQPDPDAPLLICPGQAPIHLLALGAPGQRFSKADQSLVQRLAGLAVQALRNAQIAREKDLLSEAIAGSSSGIAIADATDPDMPLVYVNRAFEALSGYAAAEVLGTNCRFLAADPADAPERTRLREAVDARRAGRFLLRNVRKSGEMFWNELSLFPVRDATGDVHTLVATQSDVTARVEAAEARDQARAQMAMALSASEDAFLILDAAGVIALSNHAVQALFPAPGPDWQVGTRFAENWQAYLEAAQDLPGRVTTMLRDADLRALSRVTVGQELDLPDGRTILVRCAALEDGGLVVTATDISPMKSAQNLLAQRLAAIEAAPDGIALTDPGGRLTYLNSAAARLMGFKRATSGLGRIWWHLYQNRIALERIEPFVPTLAVLEDRENHTHEVTSSPLEAGGHIILVRDVTDKLAQEAREEQLTQSLMRMQRQEALAQVTAGVAHDFNNYLAAINGSAALLDIAEDLPEGLRNHVQRITAAGTQSARLVNRLLDMGTGTSADQRFDLGSALRDLPDLVLPLLGAQVQFESSGPEDGLVVSGDPATLNEVLINVVVNASDAIGGQAGEIHLTATQETGETDQEAAVGRLQAGRRYACLRIRDTGKGMDDTTVARLFEPYFTTKGARGTGLGMAMVAAQLKAVGGAITVTSEPGVGTDLRLYWPLADAPGPEQDVGPAGRVDLTGRMVLIVDDDTQVSDVMARYLEAQGAEVAQCEAPEDALEAVTDDPTAWHALITDYDMPGITGGALAQQVSQVAPNLPIVVVTALARRLSDPRLERAQVRDILPKPVDLARLSAVIAQATEAGPEPESKEH